MRGLYQTERYIKTSGMDLRLLELIKYRVSQINGCAFCLDMHSKEALALGESQLRLFSVAAWRECPFYEDTEKAALNFAEALTLTSQADIGDKIYEELRVYFTQREVVILTLTIANSNTWNRLNKTFRVTPGLYEVGQYA